jgi:hypothetical protein
MGAWILRLKGEAGVLALGTALLLSLLSWGVAVETRLAVAAGDQRALLERVDRMESQIFRALERIETRLDRGN